MIITNSKTDNGEYIMCDSAEDCEMNQFEKYGINPMYFNSKANRYTCHGLRDALSEGKHKIKTCGQIEQLNKALERDEEIDKIRKVHGNKS